MTGQGDDTLSQKSGTGVTMRGDDGLDTLTSESGTAVVVSGGADADTLIQTGGSQIVLSGDDGLDALTSKEGTDITLEGGGGKDALVQTGGTRVSVSGGSDADSLVSQAGTEIVLSGDDGDDRLTVRDGAGETVGGGAGNDTIVLAGASLGTVVVTETANPIPDPSRDAMDFSGFTGGPINLNLGVAGPQTLIPGLLVLNLLDPAAIENVIGTAFADTISGMPATTCWSGPACSTRQAGPAPGWDGVTEWCSSTSTHSRTRASTCIRRPSGRRQARIEADYIGPNPASPWFHFQFVQAPPASGPFARVQFNREAPDGGTGGFAYELDFRNQNLGTEDAPSVASVQVNGILGFPNQPPESFDNWVALSAKIAAHELGHLVGLHHQDSFGPIGYGPHAPPGGGAYNPDYPGPAAGFETFDHLMSSPASVGSDRFNDLRDLYFGEREAVKLAVSESGTVVPETVAAHRTFDDAQSVAGLTVPNTLGARAERTQRHSGPMPSW